MFDLDNPEKPIEIPTKPGCMHKANIHMDEDQFQDTTPVQHIDQPATDAEKKALHFFETGILSLFQTYFDFLFFQTIQQALHIT